MGIDADGGEAIEFRGTVVESVGVLVDAENARLHSTHSDVTDNVTAGIAEIDDRTSRRYAGRGVATSVRSVEFTPGIYVARNGSGPFNGSIGWALATDVNRTRGFVMKLQRVDQTDDPRNESFRLTLDDGADERLIYVYRNESDALLVEVASSPGGPLTAVCSVPWNGTATLDLTGESLNGTACGELWPEAFEGYEIRYDNGDAVAGTYELTLQGTSLAVLADIDPDVDVAPAVYSASVVVRYESPGLLFNTTVRVAPGEPDA
jgi:hypothetical protein